MMFLRKTLVFGLFVTLAGSAHGFARVLPRVIQSATRATPVAHRAAVSAVRATPAAPVRRAATVSKPFSPLVQPGFSDLVKKQATLALAQYRAMPRVKTYGLHTHYLDAAEDKKEAEKYEKLQNKREKKLCEATEKIEKTMHNLNVVLSAAKDLDLREFAESFSMQYDQKVVAYMQEQAFDIENIHPAISQDFRDTLERVCNNFGISISELAVEPIPQDGTSEISFLRIFGGKVLQVDEKKCREIYSSQEALEWAIGHELCHKFYGDDFVLMFYRDVLVKVLIESKHLQKDKELFAAFVTLYKDYENKLCYEMEERADRFSALQSPAHAKASYYCFRQMQNMLYKGKTLEELTGTKHPKFSARKKSMLDLFQELSII